MITIHKFVLDKEKDIVAVKMPDGAFIYSVANQHKRLCLWAEVNTDNPLVERTFRIAYTGARLECEREKYLRYLGTALFVNGSCVLHVFEIDDMPF